MKAEITKKAVLPDGNLEAGLSVRSQLQVVSLVVWLVLPTLPWLRLYNYSDRIEFAESGVGRPLPVVGIAALLAVTLFIPERAERSSTRESIPRPLLLLLGILATVSILWSIDKTASLLNLGVTGAALLGLLGLRRSNQCYPVVFSAIKIAAGIFMLMSTYMMLAFPFQQRNFGGVLPNSMASMAFVVICAGLVSAGVSRGVYLSFGVGLLTIVAARGFTLGILSALTIAIVLRQYRRRPLILVSLSLSAFGLGLLASISWISGLQAVVAPFADFTDLSSETRGLNSGFTGRTSQWTAGLELLKSRPLTGFGFRTRHLSGSGLASSQDLNAHSGIINAALDLGILGTLALASQIVRMARSTIRSSGPYVPKLLGVCTVSSALWLAIEPTYWSLSRAHWIVAYMVAFLPTLRTANMASANSAAIAPLVSAQIDLTETSTTSEAIHDRNRR